MSPDEPQRRRSFHLIERIGTGAFGEVFLAELESAGGFRRKVALKLLHPHVSRRDIDRRFRDEARILGRLSHRNIVGVLDLVRLRERWAVVMDYVPGADLEQVLQALHRSGERIAPPAALEIGAAVARALHAAWTAADTDREPLEVVHRDIKPSNVRLSPDGEVKVLDFGVAKATLPDAREARTRDSGWIGTERYLSPERILCAGDGPEGDVYAATSTVVELLLGWPIGRTPVLPGPHAAFVAEALDEVRAALEGGPPAEVDALVDALARGLDAEPASRPTAEALCEALERAALALPGERLASFARRIVPEVDQRLERQPDPAQGTLSEPEPWPSGPTLVSAEPAPPRRSAGWVVAVIGLAVGAGTAFAAVRVLGGSDRPASAVVYPRPPVAEAAPSVDAGSIAAPVAVRVQAPRPEPARARAPEPAPTIHRAVVAAPDATAIDVRCGAVTGTGSTSAVIRNFPAGACEVTVHVGGWSGTAPVTIERPRAVTCTADGEHLTCS